MISQKETSFFPLLQRRRSTGTALVHCLSVQMAMCCTPIGVSIKQSSKGQKKENSQVKSLHHEIKCNNKKRKDSQSIGLEQATKGQKNTISGFGHQKLLTETWCEITDKNRSKKNCETTVKPPKNSETTVKNRRKKCEKSDRPRHKKNCQKTASKKIGPEKHAKIRSKTKCEGRGLNQILGGINNLKDCLYSEA